MRQSTQYKKVQGKERLRFIDSLKDAITDLKAFLNNPEGTEFLARISVLAQAATGAFSLLLANVNTVATALYALASIKIANMIGTFVGSINSGGAVTAHFNNAIGQTRVLLNSLAFALTGTSVKVERTVVAVRRLSIVLGMLRGVVTGVFAALGGPVGIAITAAMVALEYLWGKQAEAAAKAEERTRRLEASVGKIGEAYKAAAGDVEKFSKAMKGMSASQLANAANDAKTALKDALDTSEFSKLFEGQWYNFYVPQMTEEDPFYAGLKSAIALTEKLRDGSLSVSEFKGEIDKLEETGAITTKIASDFQDVADKVKELQIQAAYVDLGKAAFDGDTSALEKAREKLKELGVALDENPELMRAVEKASADLEKAMDSLAGAATDLKPALDFQTAMNKIDADTKVAIAALKTLAQESVLTAQEVTRQMAIIEGMRVNAVATQNAALLNSYMEQQGISAGITPDAAEPLMRRISGAKPGEQVSLAIDDTTKAITIRVQSDMPSLTDLAQMNTEAQKVALRDLTSSYEGAQPRDVQMGIPALGEAMPADVMLEGVRIQGLNELVGGLKLNTEALGVLQNGAIDGTIDPKDPEFIRAVQAQDFEAIAKALGPEIGKAFKDATVATVERDAIQGQAAGIKAMDGFIQGLKDKVEETDFGPGGTSVQARTQEIYDKAIATAIAGGAVLDEAQRARVQKEVETIVAMEEKASEERMRKKAQEISSEIKQDAADTVFETRMAELEKTDPLGAAAQRANYELDQQQAKEGVPISANDRAAYVAAKVAEQERIIAEQNAKDAAESRKDAEKAKEDAAKAGQDAIKSRADSLMSQIQSTKELIKAAEESGDTAKAEELKASLEGLTAEAIKAQEAVIVMWQGIGGPEAEAAILQAEVLLEQLRAKTEQVNAGLAGFAKTFGIDLAGGIRTAIGEIMQGVNAFKAMGTAIANVIGNMMIKIGELILQFVILSAIQAALGMPVGSLTGGATSVMKFLGNSFSGGVNHEGGVVGETGRRRKGLSGLLGMLASNERLTVLQTGEEVLTKDDPRHRKNLGAEAFATIVQYHTGGVVGLSPDATTAAMAASKSSSGVMEAVARQAAEPRAQEASSTKIVNAFAAEDVLNEALSSAPGERVLVNWVGRNASKINAALGRR